MDVLPSVDVRIDYSDYELVFRTVDPDRSSHRIRVRVEKAAVRSRDWLIQNQFSVGTHDDDVELSESCATFTRKALHAMRVGIASDDTFISDFSFIQCEWFLPRPNQYALPCHSIAGWSAPIHIARVNIHNELT